MAEEILIRNDDYDWLIELQDVDGDPLPLRNIQVQITGKAPGTDAADDSDAIYKHKATFDAYGALTNAVGLDLGTSNPDDGILREFLTPTDVTALTARYAAAAGNDPKTIIEWDMQVRDATGRHKTVLFGTLKMTKDVGRVRDIA